MITTKVTYGNLKNGLRIPNVSTIAMIADLISEHKCLQRSSNFAETFFIFRIPIIILFYKCKALCYNTVDFK